MNRMKRTKSRPNEEFLGRYGRPIQRGPSTLLPGHTGQRPRLNFVLEVLAGRDPGIVEDLLPFETAFRSYPETFGPLVSHADSVPAIQAQMISMMRRLARLWIDSGKDATDPNIDTPAKRNIVFAPNEDSPTIHGLMFARLFNTHAQWVQMTSKGKLGVYDTFPHIELDPMTQICNRSSLERYGEQLALYFFARFLDSPHSLNLARCDDCGMYFAYERARQVKVTNGVHCDRCKVADSVKRTKSSRDKFTAHLVEVAAAAWMEWKKSNSNPDQKAWTLKQVNECCVDASKAPKTKRWVTTHWNKILETVEWRKNAKG
jgi:hypothetical protein